MTHPIQLVVETTRVADWVAILHPPPEHSLGRATVAALVVHTFQSRLLLNELKKKSM